jgi:hypothetical protein
MIGSPAGNRGGGHQCAPQKMSIDCSKCTPAVGTSPPLNCRTSARPAGSSLLIVTRFAPSSKVRSWPLGAVPLDRVSTAGIEGNPKLQRNGACRALMAAVEDWLRARGLAA